MHPTIDRERAVERFAGSIPFRTVSDRSDFDLSPFLALHGYMAETWPLIRKHGSWEAVSGGSILIRIPGSDTSKPPALLSAHLDVVPVEDEKSSLWEHPPWSGHVAQGRIWGRGTLDFKAGMAGILEACQLLLEAGFRPSRTIILAFGHDEEVGGVRGAASIVSLLCERGIRSCSYVLDEGGYVYSFPWMERETAVIGLAEKGYATIEVFATGEQGHASRPASRTPVGLVAEAVSILERESTPLRLCSPVKALIKETSRFFQGITGASPEDYAAHMSAWPEGNAMVRTTLAPTIASGSRRENVISSRASTLVNFRIIPGESISEVLDRAESIVRDLDVRIRIPDEDSLAEPSPTSRTDSGAYRAITSSLGKLFPDAIVSPGIFVASTDSKHYGSLTDCVYRILPVRLGENGMGALHCSGESVGIDDYLHCVRFYMDVLEETCG
jgi:carboxypeptidase PM20D1